MLIVGSLVWLVRPTTATHPDPRMRAAYQYIAASVIVHPGYIDGAISIFRDIATHEADNVEAQVMAALVLELHRRDPSAAQFYRNAATHADDPAFRVLWADYLVRTGEIGEAEEVYRSIVAADPELVAGWIGLGRVALLRNEHRRAMDSLETALELDPNRTEAKILLARAHLESGAAEKALDALGDRDAVMSHRPAYFAMLARIQAALDHVDEACAAVQRVRDLGDVERADALSRTLSCTLH